MAKLTPDSEESKGAIDALAQIAHDHPELAWMVVVALVLIAILAPNLTGISKWIVEDRKNKRKHVEKMTNLNSKLEMRKGRATTQSAAKKSHPETHTLPGGAT
jgi:hypothetical protein